MSAFDRGQFGWRVGVLIPIEIELKPSPDDPGISTPEFQAELQTINGGMDVAGIKFSQSVVRSDAVDASGYALSASGYQSVE